MALIIGVVIVLLILFGFLCYKKAPPTEAIVVTGFGLARPKVVCGKGTFVFPVLQRADRLNMRLLKIDVKTPETGVKTQNGVSLWIDSVVTIQVYSENSTVLDEEVKASGLKDAKAYIMSRQQAAISNFLGMNEQGINDKVNDVLQGNLREIVSDMTVDQILTNRKQMALSVIENARPDLAKMGLEVVTFNVQDIRDAIDGQGHNHGVIEAIGIEQEELVKKQAEIARAQAARDVACAKADAEMAANETLLESAYSCMRHCPKESEIIVVSNSIATRIRMEESGFKAEVYRSDSVMTDTPYLGRTTAHCYDTEIDASGIPNEIPVSAVETDESLVENEFVTVKRADDSTIGVYQAKGKKLVRLNMDKMYPYGVRPKNLGQKMAIHALMDSLQSSSLTILMGDAGTANAAPAPTE